MKIEVQDHEIKNDSIDECYELENVHKKGANEKRLFPERGLIEQQDSFYETVGIENSTIDPKLYYNDPEEHEQRNFSFGDSLKEIDDDLSKDNDRGLLFKDEDEFTYTH